MIGKVIKALYLRKSDLPVHLILHNTFVCNAKCGHCFNWQNLNTTKPSDELSMEEFEKIAKSFDNNLLFLNLSGGEPFLRKDIAEMCNVFAKHNPLFSINIPTNALMPKMIRDKTEDILQKCQKTSISINLSLDGFEEFHDENRGVKGNFQKLLETYDELAELKKNYPRLSLKVITVITNKNVDEIIDLGYFVIKRMPEISFQNFLLIRGSPKDNSMMLPPMSRLKEKSKEIKKIWDHYTYRGDMPRWQKKIANGLQRYLMDLYLEMVEKKYQVVACDAWKNNVVIDALGNVQICELLPVFANLRNYNYDFKKLWYSDKAQQLKQSIIDKKCFCTHGCVYPMNVLARPSLFPGLLKSAISVGRSG